MFWFTKTCCSPCTEQEEFDNIVLIVDAEATISSIAEAMSAAACADKPEPYSAFVGKEKTLTLPTSANPKPPKALEEPHISTINWEREGTESAIANFEARIAMFEAFGTKSRERRISPPFGAEEWSINLVRSDPQQRFGATLDVRNSDFAAITAVRGGLVGGWNSRNPRTRVQPGDAILEVNGRRGSTAIAASLKEVGVLRVRLVRLRTFTVPLNKDLELGIAFQPTRAEVTCVLDRGTVADHNRTCAPCLTVIPGDELVAVSGVCGNPAELLKLLTETHGEVALTFKHPALAAQVSDNGGFVSRAFLAPALQPAASDTAEVQVGDD